jgi:hypothetical protein
MKRSTLVRKVRLHPQKKPLQRSPMSRGLTSRLSGQSHQLLKKAAKRMKPGQQARPTAATLHFKRMAMLACAQCGMEGYSPAAHSNRYQDGKGASIKAHYLATFPLCRARPGIIGCHAEHDQCIGMTREEANARTEIDIADTQRKLGIHQ